MRDLLALMKRIGSLRKYVILLILRSPFDALRTWMLANLMQAVFYSVETGERGSLQAVCVVYGLICALLFVYNGTIWSSYAAFAAETEVQVHEALFRKLGEMPLRKLDSHLGGEWITRLNSDVQGAFLMMSGALNIPHAVVASINTVLACVLMVRSSWLLFGITWLFFLPYLFINYKLVLKGMGERKEASQKAMAENTSAICPLITEAAVIRIYDAGDLLMKECEESSLRLMRINLNMQVRSALGNVALRLSGLGGYFALLLWGYYMIYRGSFSFPELVYCFQVRGAVLAGISMLIASLNNIRANAVCVKRIWKTLSECKNCG